jgi:hypothetical protein
VSALEDRLRRELRAESEQVTPYSIAALRLPARTGRGRRRLSLAYGGGERQTASARGRWWWLAPAAAAIVVVAVMAGSWELSLAAFGPKAPGRTPPAGTAANYNEAATAAAAWVAAQVSRSAVLACDSQMCSALHAHGFAGGNLLVLGPSVHDPLGADVVIATADVRSEFGARLASVYAPEIMARFGVGQQRIEVRAVAPVGAAAYKSALEADVKARTQAGVELLHNTRIVISAVARRQLGAGQVDSRLTLLLIAMAAVRPISVQAFGDRGPGASPGIPLRSADLAPTGRAPKIKWMLALLHARRGLDKPAHIRLIRLTGGRHALRIVFTTPSPLGLLAPRHGAR